MQKVEVKKACLRRDVQLKFEELLSKLKTVATGISVSTKNIGPGFVFVCVAGVNADGHEFAKEAIRLGAILVVCNRDIGVPNQIVVKDTRQAYARLCAEWFNSPAKKMKLIAVTGTNGKTTVTTLTKRVLSCLLNEPVGLIGTIQNEIGGIVCPARYTTPDAHELNAILLQMRRFGCRYVVMEASSHALAQERLFGLEFEVGVFTNLTHDHLDYHQNMDSYLAAKRKLLDTSRNVIVNIDDDYGRLLFANFHQQKDCRSVGLRSPADVSAKDINCFADRVEFQVVTNGNACHCVFGMPGSFSVENALTVISILIQLGFDMKMVVAALEKCGGVAGRAEVVYTAPDVTVIRDYAHGPSGLLNILKSFKPFAKGRLVLLFGCAGCRDRSKRKEMAKIAATYADFVVLSSDNPREEPEAQIFSDAEKGLKNVEYLVIANRLEAVHFVLQNRQPGDLILLAGKGHEDYQVLADCTVYFSEAEIVKKFFDKHID
ncbi:MAG: UDP-N-acetylmuramoyl-L-alanyl-D-glutamate--2,6-diaminopimelate ligase [Oscillospiraceae bacterium]|nr:UDP-N-acetylmuramoyl-L-alanyl-D-glutamate--2,6-diaminopimelate ligase [Oscillospiraceae bacterium]